MCNYWPTKSNIDRACFVCYRSNQEEARHAALLHAKSLNSSRAQDTSITISPVNNTSYHSNSTYTSIHGNVTDIPEFLIPEVDTDYNIAVFSGIIACVFLFGILRALMFFKVTVDASQALHNLMFSSILRSHLGFFDTNPVGKYGSITYFHLSEMTHQIIPCTAFANLKMKLKKMFLWKILKFFLSFFSTI